MMYLVSFCHGDYDDFVKLPITVCKTSDEAEIFVDDIVKNWLDYEKYPQYKFLFDSFKWYFEQGYISDYTFDIDPIPVYEV